MKDATASQAEVHDEAAAKGAVETDGRDHRVRPSLASQLGHRDQDQLLKQNDTDFPEPDAEAEHSGG